MKNLLKTITLTIGLVTATSASHAYSFSSYPNFMGGYDYHFFDNNSYGLWDY